MKQDNTVEQWKQIEGYPHLFISTKGRIYTKTYDRFLKPYVTNRGYLNIGLNKDKVIKTTGVHRLVARAFIPNPDNLPCVDHIDGNKLNNNVENLQWISYSDNTRKACIGKDRRPKPVICIETGKVYKNIKEANKDLHIPEAVLSAVVRGEFPSYHGLHFVYAEPQNVIPSGYVTVREYAEKHGISVDVVKGRVYNNLIPHIKIGEGFCARNLIREDEPWITLKRGRRSLQ